MLTRSRLMFGVVLAGGLLVGGVALSQKPPTPPVAVPGPGKPACCDNMATFEKAHKSVATALELGKWTARDHEQLQPLFHRLRTDQKIELIKKVAAARDAGKLTIEKGARLF